MSTNITLPAADVIISAMQARQRFGELLDKGFYQGRSFLVERAGKVMVAIIPATEYQQLQRLKTEARESFFTTTKELRNRVAQSRLRDEDIQALIDEAVMEVRRETAPTSQV